MKLFEKNPNSVYNRLNIPFYKRPAFASIVMCFLGVFAIWFTEKYITVGTDAITGLVIEISVAVAAMFLLFIIVNQLQAAVAKKEAVIEKTHEIEAIRNEFTNIASRDIAEASTAIKWGIRSLEPTFEAMKKSDKETFQHIRDKNDHVLEIVRNLVLLSRIERKEIIISNTNTELGGLIENMLYTSEPRTKAIGTQVIFVPLAEAIKVETDSITLSDMLLSIYTYCLERTHGPQNSITVKAFTINSGTETTAKISIGDDATPVPEYMRKDIFARAIRNPHTGELENTPLGPHAAHLLAELLGVKLEANLTDTQTSFTITFPAIKNTK